VKHIKGELVVVPKTFLILDDDGPVARCFDIRVCLEISMALNAYDKLVAERDELANQRDALCAALARVELGVGKQ